MRLHQDFRADVNRGRAIVRISEQAGQHPACFFIGTKIRSNCLDANGEAADPDGQAGM
jgi:hypothetical protein